jgi:hypothetical protein
MGDRRFDALLHTAPVEQAGEAIFADKSLRLSTGFHIARRWL